MTENFKHSFLLCALIALCLGMLSGCAEYTAYQYLDVALSHEARGNEDAALAAFEAAVAACPEDAYLRRRLGWAYTKRAQLDAAQGELEIALGLEPAYLALYRDLASIADAQHQPDAAIGWLRRAISEVPSYRDGYRDLIARYLSYNRLNEAQELLEEVSGRWVDATWAHYQLGGLYMQLNAPDQAEAAFQRVLDYEPRNDDEFALFANAHAALGNVYYEREDYENAETYYGKALELNPADHSSMNNLAWLYAVQGKNLQDGLRLSRRSLRLNPHAPTYLDTLAELYYKLGDFKRATAIVREAIALNPDDPELRAHLQQQLAKFLSARQGKV